MGSGRSYLALVCVIAALAAPAALADDWPTWRASAGRAGVVAEALPPPLSPAWTVSLGSAFSASPVVVDGRVFAAAENGSLYALSAADGSVLWSFQTSGPLGATPAVDGGVVYLPGRNGTLYALRADTGQEVWQVFHGGATVSSPLVLSDRVVIALGHPSFEIRAFARADGATLWSFDAGQLSASSPALYSEPGFEAIVCAANNQTWFVLDPATGGKLWEYGVGGAPRYATAAAGANGQIAAPAGEYDRKVYVLDVKTEALVQAVDPQLTGGGYPGKPLGADRGKTGELSVETRQGASLPGTARGKPDDVDIAPVFKLPVEYRHPILHGTPDVRESFLRLAEGQRGVNLDGVRKALAERDRNKASSATAGEARSKPADAVAGPRFSHSPEGSVSTSSPVFEAGKVYVLQRDNGWGGDILALYRADAATGASEGAHVTGLVDFGDPGFPASPFVSSNWIYAPLGRTLAVFDKANLDGGPVATVSTGGGVMVASPAAANGRVFVATHDGRVLAFTTGNAAPSLPVIYDPTADANIFNHFPTFSWQGAADPDPADSPGTLISTLEFSFIPDFETGAGVTRVELPPGMTQHTAAAYIPANTRVYWRVRLRDASGASSAWSPLQQFWVYYDPVPPDPPGNLSALAFDASVQLTWTPSASPDVAGYNVYTKRSDQSFAQASVVSLGLVTSTTIGSLINNTTYDFMVTAVDGVGNESAGLVVTATPRPDISIDGGGNFLSIQQAIDAAAPGQTVMLGPKTFNIPGGITVKGGVSVKGYAPHLTILDGQGAPVVVSLAGTAADGRVTLEMLAVTGGAVGVDVGRADVLLRNLLVVQLTGDGIVTAPQAAVEGVSLTVADNAGHGLDVKTQLASFRGMIVAGNGQFGIKGPGGITVTYSDFFGNVRGDGTGGILVDAPPGGPGSGNLFVTVAFENPAAYDYREKTGEASVDAGHPQDPYDVEPEPNGARINQGAFGNTPWATKSTVPIKGGDPNAGGGAGAAPGGGGGGGGGGGCFAGSARR
jgi:outer membrane protein assembly factor BamB